MSKELRPSFQNIQAYYSQPLEGLELESLIGLGIEARLLKDFSQWMLGKLALAVEIKYGANSLGDYASKIGVRKTSLLVYRWVVKQLEKVVDYNDLPENQLPFSVYQVVAGTDKPREWIEKAADNDWSVEQLSLEIKKEKYPNLKIKDRRIIVCPECGFKIPIDKYI